MSVLGAVLVLWVLWHESLLKSLAGVYWLQAVFWKWEKSGAKVSGQFSRAGKDREMTFPGNLRKRRQFCQHIALELGPPKLQDYTFVSQAAKFVVLHYSSLRNPGYSVFWALSQS